MRVVLAIETDCEQSVKLEGLLRQLAATEHVHVLAGSTAAAFKALGTRVPDIVLTTPLLPRDDEGLLVEHLANFAELGAHVQRLVTPMLAGPTVRTRLFSSLRGDAASQPLTAACQPDVFLQQITEYLDRAVAERRERASRRDPSYAPAPDARHAEPDETRTRTSPLWPVATAYSG